MKYQCRAALLSQNGNNRFNQQMNWRFMMLKLRVNRSLFIYLNVFIYFNVFVYFIFRAYSIIPSQNSPDVALDTSKTRLV